MKKILILLGIFLFVNGYVIAAVPNEIRYNGKIKEYKKEVTGTRNITLKVYDSATGGSNIETYTINGVQVSSGIFSVTINPTSNIDWREKDYYIELIVDNKILTPREKLTAVPYAMHSATSESGSVTATGEFSITVGNEKKLIVNSDGVKEVKGTTEYYMVPKGGIIIWSGAADKIPEGWVLCDGNNGTPDLRGRFVLGYGEVTDDANQTKTYNVGEYGGEINHTLTIDEMPSHNHSYTDPTFGSGSGLKGGDHYPKEGYMCPSINAAQTIATGGSRPHNNMPPYYVLCYIMKQ